MKRNDGGDMTPTVSRSLGFTSSFSRSAGVASPSAATSAPPNVEEPHGSEDEDGIETFQVTRYSHQTSVTVKWVPDHELAFAGILELESPVVALRESIAEATGVPLTSQLLMARGRLIKEDNAPLHGVLDPDLCECFLMRMPTIQATGHNPSYPVQAFATLGGASWEPTITLIDRDDGSMVHSSTLPEADSGLEDFVISATSARLEFRTSEGQHYLNLEDMTLHLELEDVAEDAEPEVLERV